MKLYKEMMRKLAAVGIPLLAVTMVYTLVTGGQSCFGDSYLKRATSAIALIPILQYYVFSGVVFALYGFSFLFSRAGSDVYHSLPVKRSDLYLQVLLATATWMGATIVLNVLEMLLILLISGCPFVPVYLPLSILFYFVASMLVFGATAVGCALSGTYVTALASTGLVLLLPRFMQFLFARGIVERVPIVGWLDFGALLNPMSNVATGIAVIHLRNVFTSRIMTLPHILYSALIAAILLAGGLWLFRSRPSEYAHKSRGGRIWSVSVGILLAFAVMIPITMNRRSLFSVYGGVLLLAGLAVFFIYQLIVSPKLKHAFKTLPLFLIAVCATLGFSALLDTAADSMLHTTPDAAQIESVSFRGYDQKDGDSTYTTMLIQDVRFTDTQTKTFVAQALADAVEEINTEAEYRGYDYNPFETIEPIAIHLTGGKTILRTIQFSNVDTLNELRMQNEEFNRSIRSFPPLDSVQYLMVDRQFTDAENRAVLNSYREEALQGELLNGHYYHSRKADLLADGIYVMHGERQSIISMSIAGYIGASRYRDTYALRLDTPKTVSLVMRTFNTLSAEATIESLQESITRFVEGSVAINDRLNVGISAFNYHDERNLPVQETTGFHISQNTVKSDSRYETLQIEYMQKFVDLLARAELTDDPSGLFIRLDWNFYDSTEPGGSISQNRPTIFLHFPTETDELAFTTLMQEWFAAQRTM